MSLSDKEYSKKILTASLRRSRQVFTSGGIEPVADVGKDGHSLFAYYLLKALNENEQDIIDLENLFFSRVWAPLIEYGVQRPFVGRMNTHMDENGQFILVSSQDRSASVLEALNRDRLDSQIRLAIFPWKLTGSAYKWNYLAIGGVQKSLSANETLIPLYSYYDLQTDPRPIYLDKYFLSEDVIKNLWSGSRPNFDLVYTLATQLKIDAVLMCSIYAKIFDPDPAQIDIFLIDRETRKVYKKTGNTVDYEDRGEEIISRLVEKVFRAYLESHIP